MKDKIFPMELHKKIIVQHFEPDSCSINHHRDTLAHGHHQTYKIRRIDVSYLVAEIYDSIPIRIVDIVIADIPHLIQGHHQILKFITISLKEDVQIYLTCKIEPN